MKKILVLLALLLMLTACEPAAKPVDTQPGMPSSSDVENTSSQASVPESSVSEAAGTSSQDQASSSEQGKKPAPMPEGLPQATAQALSLPNTLGTSSAGYSVSLLTPAQYHLEIPFNRSGYRGFPESDYFRVKNDDGGKFALANKNGRLLSDFDFDEDQNTWLAENDTVCLSKNGRWGIVDAATGETLIPFEYDLTEPAFYYEDIDLYKLTNEHDTKIVDRGGAVKLEHGRGGSFIRVGENYALHQDGILQFYTPDFKPLRNFACMPIGTSNGGYLPVACAGKWGIVDEDGEFVVKASFEDIEYRGGDFAVVKRNGKKGIIDLNGEITVKPEWDDIILFDGSASVERDGKWGAVVDLMDGKLAIEPMYDFISAFDSYGYASFERKGKYGILDKDGNEIIAARFSVPIENRDGLLEKGCYFIDGDGHYSVQGIVNGKGEVIIPDDYTVLPYGGNRSGEAADEPYMLVKTPKDKWGYVDRAGQFVINAQFDNADAFIQGGELAFVNKDGKMCLIDRKGNVLLETVFSDLTAYNPETMVCAMRYTDAQGKSRDCLVKIHMPS